MLDLARTNVVDETGNALQRRQIGNRAQKLDVFS
jgi:hypothetical protein